MKLMIVTPYFSPKIGGLENYAYNIARGLQKTYQWKIVVVTSNHREKKDVVEKRKGMTIYRLSPLFKLSNTPVNPLWYWKIARIIKEEKPDIINPHTPVPYIADVVSRIKKDIPLVITYHNDLVKSNYLLNSVARMYYALFGNKTLHLANKIITTSLLYKKTSPYLKNHKRKIDIITPGVDVSKFNTDSTNKEIKKKYQKTNTILFVGNLDKTHNHKGVDVLIQAMTMVVKKAPSTKLLIIGKGNNKENLAVFVKKRNLQKNIEFLTTVTDEQLPSYFAASDVVVLPSITNAEGFGMVLIEGMALKKPVIGTKVGGIPFVIDHNKNGFLVKPNEPKLLAQKIIEVLLDKKLASKMGNEGYKKVIEHFTWDKQVEKTHKLFITI